MRHRVHSSWLIASASGALVTGVFGSLFVSRTTALVPLLLFGILLFSSCFWIKRKVLSVIFALVGGLLIGIYRGGSQLQAQSGLGSFINKTAQVSGVVRDDPTLSIDGEIKLQLENVMIDNSPQSGVLWVTSGQNLDIKRSDLVVVEGKIQKGFGSLAASMYKVRIVSLERHPDIARDVRDRFGAGIRTSIDEPQASLGAGFLLGQKHSLPEKLEQDLRLLGLTHIVVASGYNLTVLVRFARRIFMRVSRFAALAVSGLLIIGFVQMTGFSPSMSRASLIAGLSLLAWYFGRAFHPVVLLLFSAGVTVFVTPSYAWGDLGWLLSFLSFVGVILYAPMLHAYFWGDKKPKFFRQVLIETVSAQLLTIPLTMMSFGHYSVLSVLANVLVVPLIPYAMFLIFWAGLSGMVSVGLGAIIGAPASLVLHYMTVVISRLATHPLVGADVHMTKLQFLGLYGIIGIFGFWLRLRTKHSFRNYNIVE